ncbi:hypothetical protein [Crocosphaera chwakensis]|uniref:Uncharacterized protein n=1 Tax=Crocosphaera chwakensis CCY0110 TaxID=391612 RepID=A3IN79_9CHRO|nr:hypothetical protein [Crocosphaera chwakensis]EAZ92056.1 hypothetical protein CY0110_00320 [Crocosphaera chwakensis CCY0110]
MSNKKYVILTTYIISMILAVAGSWFARGVYDELILYKGYFHVINGTENQKKIELTFPSGESTNVNISSENMNTFVVSNTGEGSIAVKSDNQDLANVGYVSSFNPPIIIVIMDNKVVFQYITRP